MNGKIDSLKWYSLTEIAEQRLMPWVKHHRSLVNLINEDKEGRNLLKVAIRGVGNGKRYYILGSNLRKYIEEVADKGF